MIHTDFQLEKLLPIHVASFLRANRSKLTCREILFTRAHIEMAIRSNKYIIRILRGKKKKKRYKTHYAQSGLLGSSTPSALSQPESRPKLPSPAGGYQASADHMTQLNFLPVISLMNHGIRNVHCSQKEVKKVREEKER